MDNKSDLQKAKEKQEARVKFLAERMAMLMAELVVRDMDFGEFCYDEWYRLERVKDNKHFPVCLDFVRMMLKRADQGGSRP